MTFPPEGYEQWRSKQLSENLAMRRWCFWLVGVTMLGAIASRRLDGGDVVFSLVFVVLSLFTHAFDRWVEKLRP